MLSYDIVNHVRRQKAISLQASGEGERPRAVIARMRETLREIEQDPRNTEAMASMVTIAAEGAWRAGMTPENFAVALSGHLDNPRTSPAVAEKRVGVAPATEAAKPVEAKTVGAKKAPAACKKKVGSDAKRLIYITAKNRPYIESMAPILQPMMEKGMSHHQMAKTLNGAGIKPRRAAEFTAISVQQLTGGVRELEAMRKAALAS